MAFGFKIATTDGLEDAANTSMKSAQLIEKFTTTAASGTHTVSSDFNSNAGRGFMFRRISAANDGTYALAIVQDWNNSTKVLTWSGNTGNETLDFFFFRLD